MAYPSEKKAFAETPNNKLQTPDKLQMPNPKTVLVVWCSSGAWRLALGAFIRTGLSAATRDPPAPAPSSLRSLAPHAGARRDRDARVLSTWYSRTSHPQYPARA